MTGVQTCALPIYTRNIQIHTHMCTLTHPDKKYTQEHSSTHTPTGKILERAEVRFSVKGGEAGQLNKLTYCNL